MVNRKILILGGTKFLGLKLLERLKHREDLEIHVASRKSINLMHFHAIDRKNEADLKGLFRGQNFDIIIDFICFSQPDAKKLLDVINADSGYSPYLITISSTYVYGNPSDLKIDKTYDENEFDPLAYKFSTLDRPLIDYFEGKRSMEAYIARNYQNYLMIRFPIILGSGDYTGRTAYFSDKIKTKSTFSLDRESGVSNFIFAQEASEVLLHFVDHPTTGVINGCLDDRLDQTDILSFYCKYYKIPLDSVLMNTAPESKSPFYYRKDFIIDNSKLRNFIRIGGNFESILNRELSEMTLMT